MEEEKISVNQFNLCHQCSIREGEREIKKLQDYKIVQEQFNNLTINQLKS